MMGTLSPRMPPSPFPALVEFVAARLGMRGERGRVVRGEKGPR